MNDLDRMKKLAGILTDGVTAVPGLNEKSKSEKQARFMAAAAHDPSFAKRVGIKQDVAKEFNKADTGTKLLKKAMSERIELGDESADEPGWFIVRADGFIGAGPYQSEQEAHSDSQRLHWFNSANGDDFAFGHDVDGKFVYDDSGEEATDISGVDGENLGSGGMDEFELDNTNDPYGIDDPAPMESTADAEITDDMVRAAYQARHEAFVSNAPNKYQLADYASMLANKFAQQQSVKNHGKGFDPMSGNLLPEDINNGYDDIEVADGQDFFPNGADSPVVKKVGPSGARQGDNPEQKKMQVAETHKELVYNYRKFLKESSKN